MSMHPIKKGKRVYCKNHQELKEYLIFIKGIYGEAPYKLENHQDKSITLEFTEHREALR